MADYQPFGGFGSSSRSNPLALTRTYAPPKKKKKKNDLTARQMAILLAAIEKQDEDRSFGDVLRGVGKGAVGGATWTLDKLMRPSWAVTAAVSESLGGESDTKAKNPFGAAWSGFKGETRKGFGEILDEQGVLEGHKTTRGILGLGLDIATDPTMLASVAAAPVTGGGSIAAYAAAKAGGKAISKEVIEKAAREVGEKAQRGEWAGMFEEEILQAAGPKFKERLALVRYNKDERAIPAMQRNLGDVEALETRLAIQQARAFAERKLYDPRKVSLVLGSPRHNIGVPLFPALTRPGKRLAQSNIPIVNQLSDNLGKAFVPGFDDPIYRAGEMARSHAAKNNAVIMQHAITDIMGDTATKLDTDKMRDALHYMEEPLKRGPKTRWSAVIQDRKTKKFSLNTKYLDTLVANGQIDDVQRKFIEKFFTSMEYLYKMDAAFKVPVEHFGQTGRMYVPHVLRPGKDITAPSIHQQGLLTKAGYEKTRKSTVSLQRIKEWVDEGEFDDIFETDPLLALWRRARAGAERQSDMALINALKASVGTATRLVDGEAVSRHEARLGAAQAQYEGAQRLMAKTEEVYNDKVQALKDEIDDVLDKGTKAITQAVRRNARDAKAARIAELEAQLRRARSPKRKAELTAEIKRMKREKLPTDLTPEQEQVMQALNAAHKKASDALGDPAHKAHAKAVGPEAEALGIGKQALEDAKKQMAQAVSALKKARKGKPNPAITRHHTVINRAVDEYGHPMAFDRQTADQIDRLEKFITGDQDIIEQWAKGWAKVMGSWKILVTTVNPGYRIRNSMTDTWNMFIAGVPMHAIPVAFTQAGRLMLRAKKGDLDAVITLQKAANHGIMSGLFAGDIQQVAQYIKHSGKTKTQLLKDQKYVQLYTKAAQDFNRNAENMGRLAHYLYRTRTLKESTAEASHQVRLAHFDYEDLTKFEQEKMKKIFPFYTWTRKNVPYQLRQLISRPGRYSTFPKIAQEAEYAATEGEDRGPIPGYAAESFGFRIPFGLGDDPVYLPQFGVSDLKFLGGPKAAFKQLSSQVTPLVKTPAELALNRSAFTGAEIAGNHPRNPVTPFGAGVLSMIPGADVGQTARPKPGGGQYTGPGANPYFAYVAGQVPIARLAMVTGPGSITADRNKNAALLSWLGGQSVVNADPELNAYYQYIELQDQVDKMIRGLRDEGAVAPSTRAKDTDFDKLIQKILRGDLNYG